MKIILAKSRSIKTETFSIERAGKVYILINSFDNENLELVDSEVRNSSGETVDDPALVQEIENFVSSIPFEELREMMD